jgi:hypothetical protein
MGSIDAQGVYIYDGTDQMVPHAAYSNLLAVSVSNAVENLQEQIDASVYENTQITSLSGGMTDADVRLWRRDEVCGVVFTAKLGTAVHNTLLTTIATDYRPPYLLGFPLVVNSINPPNPFLWIDTNGAMTFFTYGTAGGSGSTLRGTASWPKNL